MNTKIIIFTCNWSIAPGLHLSEYPEIEEDDRYKIIINMCSGRIDPELIIQAFKNGAWGVMIAGCPPEECEHNGNYKTHRRILLLKKVIKELGIEPERVSLKRFSNGEGLKLQKAIDQFTNRMEQLGPLKNLYV